MAEDPNQIEHTIESRRRDLGGHLDELEGRLRENTDWRTYVRRTPLVALAAAFSAGLMLTFAIGGHRR